MKKPLRLLLYCVPLLLLCSFAILFFSNREKFESEEGEGEESEAEALGPMDYWGSMRSFPNSNGEISAAKYAEAFEHMKRMPEIKTKSSHQTRVQASNWTALGPMNFSGRVLCLGFHPTNANIIFAGSAGGGLWKTTVGGAGGPGGIAWTQVPIGYPVMSVPAIAINPANANEMYIGTGEVYNTGGNAGFPGQDVRTFRGSYGIGILKSTDGGVNWNYSLPFTNSGIKGVQEILIDPSNPVNVYAATSDGVYRSTSSGALGSWTLILNTVLAMDICFAPANPNILYATCGDFGSPGSGIYKITNASTTASIVQLNVAGSGLPLSASINAMTRLSIVTDDANTMYAAVGKKPGSNFGTSGTTFGLFKSTNAGSTWTAVTQPLLGGINYIQNQGWYAHDVLASKTSLNTVYACEIDMLKSVNGGTAWTKMTSWSNWNFNMTAIGGTESATSTYVHADHHRMYFGPFDATQATIYIVTDGGVFKSTNSGGAWTGLNGGLCTAQIYHSMGMSATNPSEMVCGLQDNATLWYQGNKGCKRTTGGDGFYSIIDPTSDSTVICTYSYGSYYYSTSGIAALQGAAMNWDNSATTTTSVPNKENAAFVAPLAMANSDHTRVYLGTVNFKKSINNGSTFTTVGPAPVVDANASIMYIAVSKTNRDSVYIATAPTGANTAKVKLSTNGGTSWVDRTGTLPNMYITSMAIDSNNSKRIVLTVAGFGAGHVFITTNAGVNWTNIDGTGGTSLPDVPTNIAMIDPANPGTIYIGNDLGVFVAQNVSNGATPPTWYTYNAGLIDATNVMDLQVAPSGTAAARTKMRMGSYGKGLWENLLVTGSLPVTFESFKVAATNNGNQLTWVIGTQDNVSHYEVEYSADATNFISVGSLPARTGTVHLTYNFLHKITNTKNGYYRIKVIDMDGEIMYSVVEEVKANVEKTKFTALPNPTTGKFNLRIPSGISGTVQIFVYDEGGRLVMTQRGQLPFTSTSVDVPMDISRLAAGNYQVVCQNNSSKNILRIIKR